MESVTIKKHVDWIHERNLGSGGFGIVELWRNCRTGEKIAIKKCKDASSLSEKQKQRWIHEIAIMNHLQHPNLVGSVKLPEQLKFMQTDKMPVLYMEFCSKGDLRKFLSNPKNVFGLEQSKAVKVMSDVASGVEFLHKKNITHRDLKPENIVLKERNGEITYKLIDLGYAKELGQDSVYASLVGTLNYVAPELFWNRKYSCSVDYWSLGILFYEILTGTRPFLPHMKTTVAWMSPVSKKKYQEICAQEIGGKIEFYSEIADPVDLSESIKENIVEWFRVALQWDPKQRGKLPDSTQVVIFDLLKNILSKKELHAFIVPQYKIVTLPVDEKSTLNNLQQQILEKTAIPIHQQIICNIDCIILNNNGPLLSQVNVTSEIPQIFVFQVGNLHFKKLPNQNLPKSIERILENSTEEFDYCERVQFIKDVLFFINQEIRLSKKYQLALSVKIDLLVQRCSDFADNLKTETDNLSSLKLQVEETIKTENDPEGQQKKQFEEIIKKIEENPLKTIIKMSKRMETFNQINEELIKFSEVNLCNEFSQLFDKVIEIYAREDHKVLKGQVSSTIKLLFRFLELRSSNIEENKDILETTERILFLENELSKLENYLNSANVLKISYKSEFEELKESRKLRLSCETKSESESGHFSAHNSLTPNVFNDLASENENLIRDSIVIRHMMSNLVTKLNEEIPNLLDLDS